ncbi:suppressor of SWI4 1 homolog [Pristis pectinata]|uniref:suppressor of SWI4 1 homolog n=1 Tax=Pristis pectinata TaxID=685728 RepID=UPI00223DC8AE|nr:suppressor of SWI4 1 homolog [Pristis pectinata]
MGKCSRTKNQKKARANAIHLAQEDFASVPHSFVFHRGQVGRNVLQLITDMRRVMEPYTARSLTVRKKNLLKDFVSVAGPLGVTHFLIFTKSPTSVNFKLARLPRGPTLTFRVRQYSLMKDVVSSLKRHRMHESQFTHHPLLVLSNFAKAGMHIKLMATMFQNLFPTINVYKVGLNTIKRCVLVNYNTTTQLIEVRHYSIKVVPAGMSRGVKKLLQEKFPNMSKFEDISELLVKGANLSESEAEQDGDHNITELPQHYAGRGNFKAQQSAIRLTEIGPRLTLELVKIEEGMCDGEVMYHSFVGKSEEEVQQLLQRKEKRQRLKEERKKRQEENIRRKKKEREQHKKKSLEGMRRKKLQVGEAEGDSEAEDPGTGENQDQSDKSEDDSDREHYRQEVGVEPDDDLFPGASNRKRKRDRSSQSFGKVKRWKGPEEVPNKQHTEPKPESNRRKNLQGRKSHLVGTSLGKSRFKSSILKSKVAFKGKGRQRMNSKAKGEHPGSKGRGQRPDSKDKGQHPGSKGRGQRPDSKDKGQHPASKGKGQRLGFKAKGQRLDSKGKGHSHKKPQITQRRMSLLGVWCDDNVIFPGCNWGLGAGDVDLGEDTDVASLILPIAQYSERCVLGTLDRGREGEREENSRSMEGQKNSFNASYIENLQHNSSPSAHKYADIQRSLLPPFFGVEFVVAFIGNTLAICLFLRQRRTWHSGIVYAFSLAVNDLLYVITLPLLVVYYSIGKHWVFGVALCKVERFLFTCNLYGSALFITCISLNRYVGIVHPMFAHSHLKLKHAKIGSLVVWLLAGAITSPTFVFSEVMVKENKTECLGSASDEALPRYFTYSLFLAVVGCAIPFLLTFVSYLSIFKEVLCSQSVSKSECRRVGLLVCTVIVLYAVSFIPYTVLRNINLYRRLYRLDKGKPSPIYTAYQLSKGLVSLNTCIHPLLYATQLDNLKEMFLGCGRQSVSTQEH